MNRNGITEHAAGPAEVAALRDRLCELEAELADRDALLAQARESLQAQLLRYRELFDFAPDCYLVTDAQGVIREANAAASYLLGTPREYLLGKPLLAYVSRESHSTFLTLLIHHSRRQEIVRDVELGLSPPRGRPVLVAASVAVVAADDGRVTGLRWLLRDLGPWKRAVESLRAQKAFADALVDLAPVLVLVLDHRGRVLRANAHARAATGLSRDELAACDWLTVVAGERDAARELLAVALEGREVAGGIPLPVGTRDGGRRLVAWRLRALPQAAGPSRVLAVGHDVSELHAAQEQALHSARLAAIGQMVAGLAHESRNALQRSQACLERLRWQLAGQPDAQELIARVQRAQDDLVRLYEDVRGYATPIVLDRQPCDLRDVWREAWELLTAAREGRGARLDERVECPDLRCHGDRFRLRQVFRNLFENSLEATAEPVRVTVVCRDATLDGRPALRVAVRDNGPGLPPEARQRLFEPFFTTKVHGSGLGMAIAKRIVEAHGGTIAAGDVPGPGAEIVLTLPRSDR